MKKKKKINEVQSSESALRREADFKEVETLDVHIDQSDDPIKGKQEEVKGPVLINVPLSTIYGVHHAVESTGMELEMPMLRLPAVKMTRDESYHSTISNCYITVTRHAGRLRCVGGVRLYMSFKSILSAEEKIQCVEVYNLTDEQIAKNYLCEFLYLPLTFGIHFSERNILTAVARRAYLLGRWSPPKHFLIKMFPVETYISKIYGIDIRPVKNQTNSVELKDEMIDVTCVDTVKVLPVEIINEGIRSES